jgi:eukaryotic-like serine/threonine-protein kinase
MPLASGTRLGPYEILSAIGATKILPPGVASDPERRARFEREAKTIAGPSHPHICRLYDVSEGSTEIATALQRRRGL